MAHYDDVILPTSISQGTTTGPTTATDVLHTDSGYRKANQRWSLKLRRFNLRYGMRTAADAYTILRIFEAVEGPANSFLARAWNDWNTTQGSMDFGDESKITATDQPLRNTATGLFVGDGSTRTFQMVKRYTVGATAASTRDILKPANDGNVTVAVNSVVQTEGSPTDFTVDYATGIVTFQTAPGNGLSVTWGGVFYVPVAFINDDFLESLQVFHASDPPDIPLTEVRL